MTTLECANCDQEFADIERWWTAGGPAYCEPCCQSIGREWEAEVTRQYAEMPGQGVQALEAVGVNGV